MLKRKIKWLLFCMRILTVIGVIVGIGIVSYNLLKLDILPIKYLLVGSTIIIILILVLVYLLFVAKKGLIQVIGLFLAVMLIAFCCFLNKYLSNTYDFFKNTNKDYETISYSVLVLNESPYENLESLQNKSISYLEDGYKVSIQKELNRKINYTEKLMNFWESTSELFDKKVEAILLEESYLALAKEEIEDFDLKTKEIYTFEIQVKAHEENPNVSVNITMEPFIFYISGVDQWGNVKSVRGRSDVNMLVIVNPKTNQILLVNTPRDYYIQLDGTKGLKDKLTHAGIYGIDKSIKTLENFYDIDISHYLRVNFDSVIKIIDVIGGIDINSDKAFKPRNDSRYINKGWNHFDGKLALAYARERYAYTTGDHHRGANQQQVITAIIEKFTSSSVLISKYNTLLDSLNGSFQTDMSMEEITSFIKYQIDKMPSWKVESIAVTGTGDMQPTYSMGSKLKLYVMNPDMKSVKMAQEKIKEVLNAA